MGLLSKLVPKRWRSDRVVVPVVRLQGAIGMATPLRPGMTLASVANTLDRAFETKRSPAVALLVNSPGGSPVQSRLIYQRIRYLAEKHEKQVFVFVEDVAASGGYMIAIAGDEIYADPSSILGSIGVVSAGFGFNQAIKKLGIDRRVHTSGDRKAILDPFSTQKKADVDHLKALQQEIHTVFIDMVRDRRGEKLSTSDETFSGLFWTGSQAIERGLADGLGDLRSVLIEKFGEKVEPKLISGERGFLFRRPAGGIGLRPDIRLDGVADAAIAAIEERALWARFGL